MKKVLSVLSLLVTSLLLVACTETLDGVKGIKLNKMPADVYELNTSGSLDASGSLDGYELTVEFDVGLPVNLKLNAPGITVTGATLVNDVYYLNTSAVGDYNLVIEYKGYKVQFAYKVQNSAAWDGVTIDKPVIEGNNYQVSSPAQYAWLVQNYGQEGTVYGIELTADIDFNGNHVERIPEVQEGFVFDGGNFELKNLGKSFRGLVHSANLYGGSITFKKIKMNDIEIDTGTVGMLVYSVKSFENESVVNIENVELTGSIIGKETIVGGLIGQTWGYLATDLEKYKPLTVNIDNTLLNVNISSTNASSFAGVVAGYSAGTAFNIDTFTMNSIRNNSFKVKSANSGKNNWGLISGNIARNSTINGEQLETFALNRDESRISSIAVDSKTLTVVNPLEYLKFTKSNGAVKAYITLTYSTLPDGIIYVLNYPMDLSLFKDGDEVVSLARRLYITTEQQYVGIDGYLVLPEETILTNAWFQVTQFGPNNEVLRIQTSDSFNPKP